MKKIILCAFFIHLFTTAKSQFVLSVKAGMNSSYLAGESLDSKAHTGHLAGISASIILNQHFMVTPEMLFTKKSGELESNGIHHSDYFHQLKTQNYFLDLPILLRCKVTHNNYIDLFINSGVNIGFCLWKKQISQSFDLISILESPDLKPGINLLAGAGITIYEKVDLEFRYEYGLTDVVGYSKEQYTFRCMSLGLSYRFNKF